MKFGQDDLEVPAVQPAVQPTLQPAVITMNFRSWISAHGFPLMDFRSWNPAERIPLLRMLLSLPPFIDKVHSYHHIESFSLAKRPEQRLYISDALLTIAACVSGDQRVIILTSSFSGASAD